MPDEMYLELKAEAARHEKPATSMARHAIAAWLRARKKAERDRAISAYATKMAGTGADLDPLLERATLQVLTRADG